MAYLNEDDKEQQPGQAPGQADPTQAGGQDPQLGSSSTPAIAGGSSGGVSTAGVGAGGGGGWTNIQAYLNANKGSTGSADALSKQVGGAFDTEKKNAQTQADSAKSAANDQVSHNAFSKDAASQMLAGLNKSQPGQVTTGNPGQPKYIDPFAGQSDPTQAQPAQDPYANAVNTFKTHLNAQYGGPDSFSYGMGSQAQQYGSDLGNDQGFAGLRHNIYNQAAGGHMGSGAMALQDQLDSNNDAVTQARQSLLSKYSGLSSDIGNLTNNTNTAIGQAKNQFESDKGDLKNYLTGEQGSAQSHLGQLADTWNNQKQDMNLANVFNQGDYGNAGGWVDFAGNQGDAVIGDQGWANRAIDAAGMGNGQFDQALMGGHLGPDQSLFQFKAGDANANNIEGGDDDRTRFNAIADALGLGQHLGDGSQAHKSGYNFDWSKFGQEASDAKKDALRKLQATNNYQG